MKTRPLIAKRLLMGRKESNQTKFNYLEIELHTRHVGSHVMLWNHIRAKDYNKSTIIKQRYSPYLFPISIQMSMLV